MLYTANLAGGATGTVLAGFYLLRVYDTVVASYVAVTINCLVAARVPGAMAVARTGTGDTDPAPRGTVGTTRHRQAPASPGAIYVAAALSGFTALGAEVVWTRQLSLLFGASVYTFSLILAVFLAGLGIGSLAGSSHRAARRPTPAAPLGSVQAAARPRHRLWRVDDRATCLPRWQPTSAFLPRVRSTPSLTFAFDALRCAFALLPATILWGASFPLTLAAARDARAVRPVTSSRDQRHQHRRRARRRDRASR